MDTAGALLATVVWLLCWGNLACSLIKNTLDIREVSVKSAQLVMVTIIVLILF